MIEGREPCGHPVDKIQTEGTTDVRAWWVQRMLWKPMWLEHREWIARFWTWVQRANEELGRGIPRPEGSVSSHQWLVSSCIHPCLYFSLALWLLTRSGQCKALVGDEREGEGGKSQVYLPLSLFQVVYLAGATASHGSSSHQTGLHGSGSRGTGLALGFPLFQYPKRKWPLPEISRLFHLPLVALADLLMPL